MELMHGTCERCETPDVALFPLDSDPTLRRCEECCKGGIRDELRREVEMARESAEIFEALGLT